VSDLIPTFSVVIGIEKMTSRTLIDRNLSAFLVDVKQISRKKNAPRRQPYHAAIIGHEISLSRNTANRLAKGLAFVIGTKQINSCILPALLFNKENANRSVRHPQKGDRHNILTLAQIRGTE
jgi:hypothetical protein